MVVSRVELYPVGISLPGGCLAGCRTRPKPFALHRAVAPPILPAPAEELLVRMVTISAMLLAGMLLTQSGCVRKRMTIVSNPPGAQVFIDNHEIGTTPVSTSYVYYGTRSVRLQKDGYESVTVERNFDPQIGRAHV